MMIRAVIKKDILWPQKQEDREEGGWKKHDSEAKVCDLRRCSTTSAEIRLRAEDSQTTSGGVLTGTTADGSLDRWADRAGSGNAMMDLPENIIIHDASTEAVRRNGDVQDMV